MISKELLSEIFPHGENSIQTIDIANNELAVLYSMGGWVYHNIYELAHKCKEWALGKSFAIYTMPTLTERKWGNTSIRIYHFHSAGKDRIIGKTFKDGRVEADTEPEAILKACEWILEEMK